MTDDKVNHPSHYNQGTMEVIDAIEGLNLGFHTGNVLKYIARYKHKNGVEDLRKANWYLTRLIEQEEKQCHLKHESSSTQSLRAANG